MIDSKLIKQLDNPDVEIRKRAVKALAQTKDPDALKYLATLYKTDSDPEVRDLALKAGKYIKKFSDSSPSGGRPSTFSTPLDVDEDAYDVYPADDDRQAGPRPEEIEISEAEQDRAHSFVQMAMNHHMHGEDAKAFQALAKAFEANPKLKNDSYTTGLATTITGRSLDVTLEMLQPAMERGIRKATGRSTGDGPVRSAGHTRAAVLLLIGVAILFSGYLAMPWFDIGNLEINDPDTGQIMTMNEAFQQVKDTINALLDAASGAGALPPEAARVRDAIQGLKLNFTGLEVALVGTGLSDVLDVMGFNAVLNAAGESPMQSTQDAPPPAILDYTLLLLPVVAVLLLLIALALVVGSSASPTLWILTMVLSLGALVPVLYFYSQSLRFIITDSPDLSEIGSVVNMPDSATAFIAIGFWVSIVGLAIIIISPVIAFLLPHPATQPKAKAA